MEQIQEGSTEWMRLNPPPPEESSNPEEYWPTDQFGNRIPMDEWTVSDLGTFPDWATDWLKEKCRRAGAMASVELLKEMSPSEIRQNPRMANHAMSEIVQKMGINPSYE